MANKIQTWLQKFLGFTEFKPKLDGIADDINKIQSSLTALESKLDIQSRAIARIIAKVDPIYPIIAENNATEAYKP